MKPGPLDTVAREGYDAGIADRNPYIASSPSSYAWLVGCHFAMIGRDCPTGVRMGRGYTIWASGQRFNADRPGELMAS